MCPCKLKHKCCIANSLVLYSSCTMHRAPLTVRRAARVAAASRVCSMRPPPISTASRQYVAVKCAAVARQHSIYVPTPEAMESLASMFASHIRAGDCYCLYGAVGAGKSEFSRSFIRAVADDEFLPVPSPTFLLQNTYNDHDGPPIHHFDFYRLTKAEDFYRLNLSDSFSKAVCLMEWPERLQELPQEHLAVHIRVADTNPTPSAPDLGAVPHHVEPAASSSGGSSDGGSTLSPLGVGGEGLAEGKNSAEEEEVEEDSYADRRPRLVTLQPHGAYWADKAQRVLTYIAAHGEACEGLAVVAGMEQQQEQQQQEQQQGRVQG